MNQKILQGQTLRVNGRSPDIHGRNQFQAESIPFLQVIIFLEQQADKSPSHFSQTEMTMRTSMGYPSLKNVSLFFLTD